MEMTEAVKLVVGLVLAMTLIQSAQATWWYLGLPVSRDLIAEKIFQNGTCDDLDMLEPYQIDMCNDDVGILGAIGRGARLAIRECQHQFKDSRWNCPTYDDNDVFGVIPRRKTPEAAFVKAITSAGVAYAVTKACATGQLKDCGCDPNPGINSTDMASGGCSDDADYGVGFSRRFLDPMEKGNQARSLMNLWNNEVGRKLVAKDMKLHCRCHAKSCAIKTCWKTVQSFRLIGTKLKTSNTQLVTKRGQNLVSSSFNRTGRLVRRDMVYLARSPSFCDPDPRHGLAGTSGRSCNVTEAGRPGGCDILCCDRGYKNVVTKVETRCNCRFHWCCEVRCDTCVEEVVSAVCN